LVCRLGISWLRLRGKRRISQCRCVGRLLFVTRGWRIACDHGVPFLLFQRRSEISSDLEKRRGNEKTAEKKLTRSVEEQHTVVDIAELRMPLV
jgi:hypothetical protein